MCDIGRYFLHLFLIFQVLHEIGGIFFHEPSYVVLKPDSGVQETFGFSLAYQNEKKNLVTGAPHSSRTGKVFNCPMGDVQTDKTILCHEAFIDVDKLAPYNQEFAPNVKLNLGYSVSATEDYLFTCAPLWSGVIKTSNEFRNHTLGTCFLHNGTVYRYKNVVETYNKNLEVPRRIIGGYGLRTLADNHWLIIAKVGARPSAPDLVYAKASNALAPVVSIADFIKRKPHAKYLSDYQKLGLSIAAGRFFNNKTIYAISGTHNDNNKGVIHFIAPYTVKTGEELFLLTSKKKYIAIHDSGSPGTMFGAAMCSADLNWDQLSELVVGAPAWGDKVEGGYDAGALHIYFGGEMFQDGADVKKRHRIIRGTKDGSRFGTALAANDLDEDGLTEIFVSAPYEDLGTGAVYILSGYEINKLLKGGVYKNEISMSDLRLTQRIQNSLFKTFGLSLQVIPDVDGNGCNELAVGSPRSQNIMFLRCSPLFNVTVEADVIGDQPKLLDKNFELKVCVMVEDIKNKSLLLPLILNNQVEGSGVSIDSSQTTIKMDLAVWEQKRCENIVVTLDDNEPGDYIFRTRVHMDEDKMKDKAFNISWGLINPVTIFGDKLRARVDISRRCKGSDCDPLLSTKIIWPEGNIIDGSYDLGSSESLTAKLVVTNTGNSSWDACALVNVTGASVEKIGCVEDMGQYKCLLPKGFRRNTTYTINLKLNMSQPNNVDDEIKVDVILHDFCDKPKKIENKSAHLNLKLVTKDIILTGSCGSQIISDTMIQDSSEFNDAHEFWVENKGKILWKKILAEIEIFKQPFISTPRVSNWSSTDMEDKIVFSYYLDLLPGSKQKIIASMDILKNMIVDNLNNNSLTVRSTFNLYLQPTSETLSQSLSSIIAYNKETKFANNKLLIILVGILSATLILACIMIVLIKMKFFTRPDKEKLEVVQEQVRIRRESIATMRRESNATLRRESIVGMRKESTASQSRAMSVRNDDGSEGMQQQGDMNMCYIIEEAEDDNVFENGTS